jgi:hypothetical protein
MSGSASREVQDRRHDVCRERSHVAYVFASTSDKQSQLFYICEQAVGPANCFLLYIAGKQGVKGIRLSLKDVGFDVATYERRKQMHIADADDWFLLQGKQRHFKSNEELKKQLDEAVSAALSAGYPFVTVVAETDSLVRKGHYRSYEAFDRFLGTTMSGMKVAFLCAFDSRELEAAGVKDANSEIAANHANVLQ